MKGNRKIKILAILTSIVVLGAGSYGIYYNVRYQNYVDTVNSIVIKEVNLNKIKDGEYTGEYDVDFISAKVKVSVINERIEDIEYIYHNNDRGGDANVITKHMIKNQKIKVDTISGATNSSKVIQKAVEVALSK